MIDIDTQQRLEVSTDGTAGPYLMVPLDQLADVKQVLDRLGDRYSVSKDAVQVDGKPFIALIDFGRSADARRIQDALDAA